MYGITPLSNDPQAWFQPMPQADLDDLVGMSSLTETLRSYVNVITSDIGRRFGLSSSSSAFLFYGPPGTGKLYLVNAFAHAFMEKGCQFLRLRSADILSQYVGQAEKTVDRAFREAMDHAPCVLFFEDIHTVCKKRDASIPLRTHQLTTAFLQAYSTLRSSGKQVILIGETSAPWELDQALTDRCRMFRVPYPNDEVRAHCLSREFQNARLEGDLSIGELVRNTAQCTYREMHQLAQCILHQLVEAAIGCCAQPGQDGDPDQAQRALQAIEAIRSGRVCPTRTMLAQALQEHPPRDKTAVMRALAQYEDSFRF